MSFVLKASVAGNSGIVRSDATPEGSITASIGDLAIDTTNGKLYLKATGTATNTGWVELLNSSAGVTQAQDLKLTSYRG